MKLNKWLPDICFLHRFWISYSWYLFLDSLVCIESPREAGSHISRGADQASHRRCRSCCQPAVRALITPDLSVCLLTSYVMSNPNSSPTTTCQLQPILLSSSAFTQNAMSRFSQWNFSKAVMTTSIISSWQIGKLGRRGWHFAGKCPVSRLTWSVELTDVFILIGQANGLFSAFGLGTSWFMPGIRP